MSVLLAFKFIAALAIIFSFVWLWFRMLSPGAVENVVGLALANGDAVRRILGICQVVAGIVLCVLGYAGGHDRLHLILEGARSEGRVISYRQVHMPNSGGAVWTYTALPTVVFEAGGRTVRFEDWMGTTAEVLNRRVAVLYDAQRPAMAMIDRSVMNWVPWAPMVAVGLLLLLSFARHEIRRDNIGEGGRN